MRIASTENTASRSPPICAFSTAAPSIFGEPFDRIAVFMPFAFNAASAARASGNASSLK